MFSLNRIKATHPLGRWWWTVDRPMFSGILMLMLIGAAILAPAASPAVAERLNLDSYHFVYRQLFFLGGALAIIVSVSLLSPLNVRRLAILVMAGGMLLMVAVLFVGVEVKGAHRWIWFPGGSLQPSEFVKTSFAVVAAWLFAAQKKHPGFPGNRLAIGLWLLVVALLVLQPDIGMTITISAVWGAQFFLAGLSLYWVALLLVSGVSALFMAYIFLPHVASRIDRFMDPSETSFQVEKSLEAFRNGGFMGVGPGDGVVKQHLPDAHTDFVFAVAGEEFGVVMCLVILALFAFVVLRGFLRMRDEKDVFIILAVSGLLIQFGFQAVINIGVALNLLPTKGMTLPFLSYGGSSTFALALGMGMVLALTRRRYGAKGTR